MARRLLTWAGLAAVVAAAWSAAPASAQMDPVPAGFDDSPLITGVDAPTAVRFGPAGEIFVAEKGGTVKAFDQPLDPTPTTVVDLSQEVHDFWDRGLLGMALDPQFAATRRIWLLYARDGDAAHPPPRWGDECPDPPGATKSGCVITGRLVHVTLDAQGVAGDPVPVIENEWCAQFPSHTVGTVAFGPDGMLYVSAGDGANFNDADWGQFGGQGGVPVNPCGDAPGEGGALRAQDHRTPGDPATLSGTIIRVDPSGAPAANRDRVIAYGVRNPFRFAFRPGTTELWVGDVGWYGFEEVNRVDTADADVENLGWPCFEGYGPMSEYKDVGVCEPLTAGEVTPPVFAYAHGVEAAPGDGCPTGVGSSISGIAFHGVSHYPATYDGALFFADYARGCIWSLRADAQGRPVPATATVFARGDALGWSGAADLQIGPEGELVYASINSGEIRRIRYRAPRAVAAADVASGDSPLRVRFSAEGSWNPAGGPLAYAWDLDGDGAFDDGDTAVVDHVYEQPGRMTARVRVVGASGRSAVAAASVVVDTEPPSNVGIQPRQPLAPWTVGDRLSFDGSAADENPDTLTYTWTLTIRHCEVGGGCHSHHIEQRTGPSATFTAPDHEWPAHLLVTLVARDEHGLETARTLRLDPATVTVRAATDPAALAVGLNGASGPAPSATLLAGSRASLSVVSPQVAGGRTYRFASWSDGSAEPRRTVAVTGDATFVARFAADPVLAPPAAEPRDTTPPRLRLISKRVRSARVRVACPYEACSLWARVRGARGVVRTLAAGRPATVKLRLPARVRRALREGRRVTARLELTATDAAGNRTRLRRTLRVAGARRLPR